MKVYSIDRDVRSFLAAPVFAVGWIGFIALGVTATIYHDSTIALQISNFSHPAIEVRTEADIDTIAIADGRGKVGIKTALNSLFATDELTAVAYSIFQSSVWGEERNYLARTNTTSTLMGRFEIPANTEFSFDLNAYTFLENFTSDLSSNPVSSLGTTSVFLQDISTGEMINVFEVVGFINTGILDRNNTDSFTFRENSKTKVLEYLSRTSFGGEEETIDFNLTASFDLTVSRDTEFALFASTRSCVDTSKKGGICTVPEPSNALGLIAGAMAFGCFRIFGEVMNRVVQLIF